MNNKMVELKRNRTDNYFTIKFSDGEGFERSVNLTNEETEALYKQLELQIKELKINKEA